MPLDIVKKENNSNVLVYDSDTGSFLTAYGGDSGGISYFNSEVRIKLSRGFVSFKTSEINSTQVEPNAAIPFTGNAESLSELLSSDFFIKEDDGGGGIITDNLVLHVDPANPASYPGSGTLLTDLTGNYNATLVNGVGFTPDDDGALVFDGVDDYGTFGNVLNFGTGDAWTVSIWFNNAQTLASTGNIYGLISKRDINGVNGWTISLRGGAAKGLIIRFTTTGLTSDLAPVADYTSTFSDGNWHNLTVTYGTDDIGKLYVDGSFEVQKSFPNYNFTNTRRLLLSSFEDNVNFPIGQFPLNGKLSEVLVYEAELSAEEVLSNYNATASRY